LGTVAVRAATAETPSIIVHKDGTSNPSPSAKEHCVMDPNFFTVKSHFQAHVLLGISPVSMVRAGHRRDSLVLAGRSTGSAVLAAVSVALKTIIVRLDAKRAMEHASRSRPTQMAVYCIQKLLLSFVRFP